MDIIKAIKSGKRVIAICAPATEGQFGKNITMGAIREALKKTGFADMVEVGLGGDMTAAYEAKEWIEARKEDFIEGMICPGGCVGGPSKHTPEAEVLSARNVLFTEADSRKVLENLKAYPMDKFSMHRDGHMDN